MVETDTSERGKGMTRYTKSKNKGIIHMGTRRIST